MQKLVQMTGATLVAAGALGIILAPFIGASLFDTLWGVEPLAYLSVVLIVIGLTGISTSFLLPHLTKDRMNGDQADPIASGHWSEITQQYFELFHHDLSRPLTRILGRERELRAVLQASGEEMDHAVTELLDEIEGQVPDFRLMMSNIQVLVQLEARDAPAALQTVEPAELIRKIVDRYGPVAASSGKEITWWAEPSEFGIVYADSSSIEHVVTNLTDNAIRFAESHVEIKLTKNPTHFLVRIWDDGPGIASQYIQHIFDRGWTPATARREEKTSSGLGLFIARTLARRFGGELSIESVVAPDPDHHTAFLLSLPLGVPGGEVAPRGTPSS